MSEIPIKFINSCPAGYLPKLLVKNHPSMKNSKKHIKLKKMIERLLIINKNKFSKKPKNPNISIFIGSTASILECLERGIDSIHVCEENLFDLYHPKIWKSLKVRAVSQNVYQYKIKKFGNCIKLGKYNSNFTKFGV